MFYAFNQVRGRFASPYLMIFALFFSCVTQYLGTPQWLADTQSVYPSDQYLTSIGKGFSESAAKRNAAGEIAGLFESRIQFTSKATLRYQSQAETQRKLEQVSSTASDETIYGIEYTDSFLAEDGSYYVLAYLDREKTSRLYLKRLEQNSRDISQLQRQAYSQEETLSRYIFYNYALEFSQKNGDMLRQLQIIDESATEEAKRIMQYKEAELIQKRSEYAKLTPFRVFYNGDEELKELQNLLGKELTKLGFPREISNSVETPMDIKIIAAAKDINLNDGYSHIDWRLSVSMEYLGKSLAEYSKSGRETSVTRRRTLTTLFRVLKEDIETEFMDAVYNHFKSVTGN